MKRTLYIAGGFTLAFLMPFNLQAQNTQPKDTTMNRTVVVEQEYNPDILDASKVNVLPKVEEPTVSKKEVEYATTFFPATSIPADLMRPYVGTEVQPGASPDIYAPDMETTVIWISLPITCSVCRTGTS